MKNEICWRRAICALGLISLMLFTSAGANFRAVSAQPPESTGWEAYLALCAPECSPLLSQIATPEGETLIVTNAGEELNGDRSSPAALIANPGPDGISLREAMIAAEASAEFDVIRFASALSGASVSTAAGLPSLERGNVFIDGDIDGDGRPDITLDGTDSARDTAFDIFGGSNVMIRGFTVRNFDKSTVYIRPDPANGKPVVSGIIIYQNDLSSVMNAVELNMWQISNSAIRNVEIVENNMHDSGGGVSVHAGMGDGATNNQVEGVKILSNIITNRDNALQSHAVFLSPASSTGLSNNAIRDVEIRGNHISNHIDTTILIDASNQANCNNNITENIVIADNWLDGKDVTIEVLVESGMNSSGNQLNDIAITGNVITTGGLQFSGATGYNAHNNAMSNVLIERNLIHGCMANGIYLSAGTGGAYSNTFEHITLRSNAVYDCVDAGILLHGETSSSPNNTISDVTITNQTLVKNGLASSWSAGGININSKADTNTITGVSFTNSILRGNKGEDAIQGALAPDVVTNNILNDARFTGLNDNFYKDPLFVDPTAGDYRLQAGSPGVDSGDPVGASIGAQDLDGHLRLSDGDGNSIAVVDRGAWEFGALAAQEINVAANSVSILDGDVVPAPWDGTDFGAAELGATPVEQVFSIENSGALPLTLGGNPVVSISGTHASDFVVIPQPGALVLPSGSVDFTIAFTPQAAGLRQALVSIASDDADENPYTFAIQGTGTVTPTSPEIDVRGNGVSIVNNDSLPATADGTDFGSTPAGGGRVEHTFTVHNTGNAGLNLEGVGISGGQSDDFWVLAQPATLVPVGGSISFTIAFTPQAAGLRHTTVRINNDDADENPYTFAIQGTATAPEIDVRGNGVSIVDGDISPTTADGSDFGSMAIGGGRVEHSFAIHNLGNGTLTLSGNPIVAISGAQAGDFAVLAQPGAQVAAGNWVNFTIAFTPQDAGLRQAVVSIANNDANENPYTFAIQGSATTPPSPDIELRGNGILIPSADNLPATADGTDFGSAEIAGASLQRNFAIHNNGNGTLTLSGNPVVTISGAQAGDFAVLAQPVGQVATDAWVNFTIVFTPQAAGLRKAVVSIASDDANENPYTFAIQGSGTTAPPPVLLFLPLVLR